MAGINPDIRIVGLPEILRKLDGATLTAPAKTTILQQGTSYAAGQIVARAAPTWLQAHNPTVAVTDNSAIIGVPSFPYRFIEFGTHEPVRSGSGRALRRNIARLRARFRRNIAWHIVPRHFIRAARNATRLQVKHLTQAAIAAIEKAWAA